MAKTTPTTAEQAQKARDFLIVIGQDWFMLQDLEVPPDEDWYAAYPLLPRFLPTSAQIYFDVKPSIIGKAWKKALEQYARSK